jgi:hypothetical protein
MPIYFREEPKYKGQRVYRAILASAKGAHTLIQGGISQWRAVALMQLLLEVKKVEKDIMTKLNSKEMQQELIEAQKAAKG